MIARFPAFARFVLGHGILSCGVPIALGVFAWQMRGAWTSTPVTASVVASSSPLTLLARAILEWGIGAGSVIGALWWGAERRRVTRR